MKRIISTFLVCVLLVGCVFSLAACGKKLSGKYQLDAIVGGKTYEFKGKNVVITYELVGIEKSIEGEYSIAENDKGNLEITFTFADDVEDADDYKGTFAFAEGEEDGVEYIKIAGVKYKKAD
jgi:uncharacterized protein YbbC (DUF1343 family)